MLALEEALLDQYSDPAKRSCGRNAASDAYRSDSHTLEACVSGRQIDNHVSCRIGKQACAEVLDSTATGFCYFLEQIGVWKCGLVLRDTSISARLFEVEGASHEWFWLTRLDFIQ